jgi:septum formation protein
MKADPLILASTSPRRRELLLRLGLNFEVVPSPYQEYFDGAKASLQAARLARGKVEALLTERPEFKKRYVLGADTLIDIDGEVVGKAEHRQEAEEFLLRLSGKRHQVITALALQPPASGKNSGEIFVESESTSIAVAPLSLTEVRWYLSTDEWIGAAGAYRIQGAGAVFVERIEGCFFNVMGLPLRRFYGMLGRYGYDLLQNVSDTSSTA